ncbi:MAG TPA: VWA domain-containing protein [Pyrinomonadaceae bacterium]|jgi:VWFA-related protein
MSRQNATAHIFAATLLTAAVLLGGLPFGRAQAQQEETPPAPPRHMRPRRNVPPAAPRPTPGQGRASAADDDDDVVRVDTDLTSILLTAIDKERRFVTTLRRQDVRVLEDNLPQELSIFERETDLPLSLAILVDTSRSQAESLPDEQAAARGFVDSVMRPDKDQAAVISFTGDATLQQPLTNNPELLRRAIESIKVELPPDNPECEGIASVEQEARCWTGIWDALWVTVGEVLAETPERTRRAIILLSDGDDTSSQTKKDEAIDLAVKNNVVIYSIGIGNHEFKVEKDTLLKLSEKTGGRAFFPPDKAALQAAFAQIQQELRAQYLLGYSPANRRRDGSFRQVKVEIVNPELRKQKLRLLYRQGYYAKKG